MNRFSRSALAALTSTLILIGPVGSTSTSMAQVETSCDQIPARLEEIQAEQADVRSDYTAAVASGDMAAMAPFADRFDGILTETSALLQRIDECSRSPIPSLAD